MNCIDCRYSLIKDGHSKCTYEEGECIKINVLEKENAVLERKLEQTEKDLADYQFNYPTIKELQKENAELKKKVSYLEDNLRVARKDREKLQLDVAKGLKEFVTDFPATAFRYLANEKYIEQLSKAKEIIRELLNSCFGYNSKTVNYEVKAKAEQFLNEVEK